MMSLLAGVIVDPLVLIVLEVSLTALLFSLAILVHELGHLYELRRHWPRAKISWDGNSFCVGEEGMYERLEPSERGEVYSAGLWQGLIPLMFIPIIVSYYWGVAALLIYVVGSRHDIKNLYKTYKEK